MPTDIFDDPRTASDRRGTFGVNGHIHCRRRTGNRRCRSSDARKTCWWLQTNYVDKEHIVFSHR